VIKTTPNLTRLESKMISSTRRSFLAGGLTILAVARSEAKTPKPSDKKNSLLLSTVVNNPEEPPFNSKYNDPNYLRNLGFNGMVPRIFVACAIFYDTVAPQIIAQGSSLRERINQNASQIDKMIANAKAAGLPFYPVTDLLVLPRALQQRYREELAPAGYQPMAGTLGGEKLIASITRSRTKALIRAQINEIFDRFPDLGGITIRYGETYLHEWPEYVGSSPAKTAAEQTELINLLKNEICEKRGKVLIYRTWDWRIGDPDNFHANAPVYEKITDAVEPHPLLIFSMKHTRWDFIRQYQFNPNIGIGKHRQIVEISTNQAGVYGKNAHPYYIGRGLIEGWPESKRIGHEGPANCLKDALNSPQHAGLWIWQRGDGWRGPHIGNELWVDLNTRVLADYAQHPDRSEESLFNNAAGQLLGLKGRALADFRTLCLLTEQAVLWGQDSELVDIDEWWVRDDGIAAVDLTSVIVEGKVREVVAEKRAAVSLWRRIEALSKKIPVKDATIASFFRVSATYGRIKYELFEQIWIIQLLAAAADISAEGLKRLPMRKAIRAYDRLWEEWQQLKADNPDCPTLYSDSFVKYVGYPYTTGVKGPELKPFREALERYRLIVFNGR
jgi:hypothetical protein